MHQYCSNTSSLLYQRFPAGSQVGVRRRRVPARYDFVQEGEPADSVYVLVDGWATPYRTFEDGRRQIMSVFVPGDCCHFDVLEDRPFRHSICAITPCVVDVFPQFAVRREIERHPELNRAFWLETLASIAVQQEWTVMLGRRTAVERLGHLFCEIFHRVRRIGGISDDSCYFPLTQVDLADAVGLTPVHLNRTLQALRSMGMVILNHRRLTIPNVEQLARVSLFAADYLERERPRASTATSSPFYV